MQSIVFSDFRENAGSRKNTWPMTAHRYPVIRNVCGRFDMVTIKIISHRSTSACCSGRNPACRDRGFFSTANINELYRKHMKFLIGAKLSLNLVKTHFDSVRDKMRVWPYYNQAYQVYACCLPITWGYVQERPYKKTPSKQTAGGTFASIFLRNGHWKTRNPSITGWLPCRRSC